MAETKETGRVSCRSTERTDPGSALPAEQESGRLRERKDAVLPDPEELETEGLRTNLPEVQAFIEKKMIDAWFPQKTIIQTGIAVEEIFVNIAQYAYAPGTGKVWIRVRITQDPLSVTLRISDRGIPYDPLSREDPDVKLPAEERPIGGLGIFMTKRLMDDVSYEYKDGKNILTIRKSL